MGGDGTWGGCVREWVPPSAGEQAATQEARSQPRHSWGLHLWAGGRHQRVLFSQEEQVFLVEHIQFPFLQHSAGGWGGKEMEGGREGGRGVSIFKPLPALVLEVRREKSGRTQGS